MTLPRKGTRTIKVDGTVYRWRATHGGPDFTPTMVTLHTHVDKQPADSVLEVHVWTRHASILTPELVASLIRGALTHGWEPQSKGTFRLGPNDAARLL